jgi:hypothetical protein
MMTLTQRVEVERHLRAVTRILDANSSVSGGEWRLDSVLADGRAVERVFRIDGYVKDPVVKLAPTTLI